MNRHDVVRLGRIAAEGRSSNTIQETESLIGLEEVERFAALVEAEERHCLSLIRLRAKS